MRHIWNMISYKARHPLFYNFDSDLYDDRQHSKQSLQTE